MVEFKLTIGDPKTKKCFQRTVSENAAKSFVGMKVGDTLTYKDELGQEIKLKLFLRKPKFQLQKRIIAILVCRINFR